MTVDDMNKLRAEFEAWATSEGLIQQSHGIRSVNSMCDVAFKAWCAARRQPDAGVVSDEQVKEAIRKFSEAGMRNPTDMMGAMRAAIESLAPASPVPASVRAAILEEAYQACLDVFADADMAGESARFGAVRCGRAIRALASQPVEVVPPRVDPLPQWLINLIGEYGHARKNDPNEANAVHAWTDLINGIKKYAFERQRMVVPEQRSDSTEVKGFTDEVAIRSHFEKWYAKYKPHTHFATWQAAFKKGVEQCIASQKGGADAVDAQRYRFIREFNEATNGVIPDCMFDERGEMLWGVDLDTAIDRAIAAESAAQGGKG